MFRRLFFAASFLCFASFAAQAQVVFDAKGSAFGKNTGAGASVTSTYTNMTVGSGSNRALVVTVVTQSAAGSNAVSPTAFWDSTGTNQAMTLIKQYSVNSGGLFIDLMLFGLRNPTSGNKTLSISYTLTASTWINYIDAVSFTGVSQVSDAAAFQNNATNTGTSAGPASVTITSAASSIVVGLYATVSGLLTGTTSDTKIYVDADSVSGANYGTGSASKSVTASLSGSDTWYANGVSVSQAATASHCNIAAMGAGKC